MYTMYSVFIALTAITAMWLAEEFQLRMPHWAMLSAILTSQSLRSSENMSTMVRDAIEQFTGSFIGIFLGLITIVYMQLLVSDTFRSAYYLILFIALMIASQFEIYQRRFRLAPVACSLMVSLLSRLGTSFNIVTDYTYSLILGVCVGVIYSFIAHWYQNKFINT